MPTLRERRGALAEGLGPLALDEVALEVRRPLVGHVVRLAGRGFGLSPAVLIDDEGPGHLVQPRPEVPRPIAVGQAGGLIRIRRKTCAQPGRLCHNMWASRPR